MNDRVEVMLSTALQDVTRHLGEARRNVLVLEKDADRIERLYAIHLQMREDDAPPTQSFPAVPPAAPCPACGAQRYQEDDALLHVVNGRDDCPPATPTDPAQTVTDPPATTPKDGA